MRTDSKAAPGDARWAWGAGSIAGVIACTTLALTGQRVEAWSSGSRMMQTAARYIPQAGAMVADLPAPSESVARRDVSARPAPRDGARRGRALTVWDRPMREVWPAENEWTPAREDEYSRFVTAIGRGIVERRCIHLDDCIVSPSVNPLYDGTEVRLGLRPDCADLPYLLRGYFAFKRHLPFGFVAAMGGEGGDPRYLHQGVPQLWRSWTDFSSPRDFFDQMPSFVHSGMFRLSPKIEDGDTYAPRIDRASVRPGSMYYDVNGHVLVVAAVEPDGAIQFIDAHPGGSISHPHFDTPRQSVAGSAVWGGGFRNWRPLRVVRGEVVRDRNWQIADFAPLYQYDHSNYVIDGAPVEYDDWVRHTLRVELPADDLLHASR